MTTLPATPLLEDALTLATQVHRGQTYPAPGGEPFILHPLRVMLHVASPAARIVAVLHDTIEDTPLTLAALGYPPAVVAALDLLTHRDADSYDAYIARLAPDPLTRHVKLADLADNLANNRRLPLDPATRARITRYEQAITSLRAVTTD